MRWNCLRFISNDIGDDRIKTTSFAVANFRKRLIVFGASFSLLTSYF